MTLNPSASSLRGREQVSAGAAFDPAALVQRCAGDRALAAELATLFVQNVDTMLEAITGALARKDAVAVERAAHALKGMVANFGTTTAVSLAGEIERSAKSGHIEEAVQIRPRLSKAVEDLRQAVQRNFCD